MRKETNFERLIHALCVDQGYCGSLQDGRFAHVTDFIPKRGYVRVDDFLDWVFWAEDEICEGPLAMRQREILRGLLLRHMGSDTVFAGQLEWPS